MLLIHHEFQHPCYFIALSMSLIFSKSIITFMFKTLPYFLGKNLHVCSFSWTKRIFYLYRSYKKCIVLLGENFNSSYKVSEPLFFVTFCSVSMRFFTFSFENMLLNISKTWFKFPCVSSLFNLKICYWKFPKRDLCIKFVGVSKCFAWFAWYHEKFQWK